jgi:hypothetical protein
MRAMWKGARAARVASATPARAALAGLAACASAVLLAAPAAGSGQAVSATSPWRLFGGTTTPEGGAVLVPTWAANRAWVLVARGGGGTLASARVTGRTVTSFNAQRLSPGDVRGVGGLSRDWFVDGRLIVRTGEGQLDDSVATARLLPDGRLGASEVVPDDLPARAKEAVPEVEEVSIHNAVRVGRRTVWAVAGLPPARSINDSRNYLLACCSESGTAVDLTRFKGGLRTVLLLPRGGWDARGRLWLAWLDNRSSPGALLGVPRMLELDASTLAPRSQAVAAPGVSAVAFELVCASTCRIVAQTSGGDIVSWAPGERSTTRVARGWRPRKVPGSRPDTRFLAAAYRSGHLVVAYHGMRGETAYADASVHDEIRIVRGDARGAGAREVGGSIRVANEWPPGNVGSPPAGPLVSGTFAPGGLIVVEQFQFTRRPGGSAPLLGAVVPFR